MKRKHKTYSRPKRPFDKPRIEEEAGIMEEFGYLVKNFIQVLNMINYVNS